MNTSSLPRTRLSPSPSPGPSDAVTGLVVKKEGSPSSTYLSSRPGVSRSSSNNESNAIHTSIIDHKSPTPPASNPEPAAESDSEAETIVLSGSRSRVRRNGPDESPGRPSKRKANGKSRGEDNEDAYSSDLSSAPSSSPPTSKSALLMKGHRRTVSQPALSHSPSQQRSSKSDRVDDAAKSPKKRKAGRQRDDDERSPDRKTRIKSSTPSSPPSVITNSNVFSHKRTRSVQTLGPTIKQSPRLLKSRKNQPAPIYLPRDLSPDEAASTSSSRSSSPGAIKHRRRPSLNGTAGSPQRAISGAHRSKRDNAGRTLFSKQCQKGHLLEAKKLLELEPEVLTEADNAGYLPIHAAALNGHIGVIKFLIKAGSPIDQPAKDLSTPLLDAVENHHTEVIRLLLGAGADPRKRNKEGQTVIDVAAEAKQECVKEGDSEDEEVMVEIEAALQSAVVKLRSKKTTTDDDHPMTGINGDSSSSRGVSVASPVHMSPPPQNLMQSSSRRRTGRSEATRQDLLWLDSGKGGLQKLRDSSKIGDIEMVGKLLESGNTPDDEAVILAAKGGHIDVLGILLAYGGAADPDPKEAVRRAKERGSTLNPGEETPLLATIGRGGSIEVLKLLLRTEGTNPRRLDLRGRTYIELAKARQGENMEEELKILQKAWDDSVPPKSKKSLKDKIETPRDKSPAATTKIRRNSTSKNPTIVSEDIKSAKRQRRLSMSAVPSSIAGDSVISDRDATPAPVKKLKTSSLDKERKREKERKALESDMSIVSDSNTATTDLGKKKRRLVSGKDLANSSASTKDILKTSKTVPIIRSSSVNEDEDINMGDAPLQKRHSTGSADSNLVPKINGKEKYLDPKSASVKRHRDSSVSSAGWSEKMTDTDASSSHKKRRKLEQIDAQNRESKLPRKKSDESRASVDVERVKNKENRMLQRVKTEDESTSGETRGRKRDSEPLSEPIKKKKRDLTPGEMKRDVSTGEVKRDASNGVKKDRSDRDARLKLKEREKSEIKKEMSAKSVLRQKQEASESANKQSTPKTSSSSERDRPKSSGSTESAVKKSKLSPADDGGKVTAKKRKSLPIVLSGTSVNEKERQLVLLREQRSAQQRGLMAAVSQRAEYQKIKADKDRERELIERADQEAERELREEEERENEIANKAAAERAEIRRIEQAKIREQKEREDEAQRKLDAETERLRIQSLPYIFREAASTDDKTLSEKKLLENSRRFMPVYVADLDGRHTSPVKGVKSDAGEMWISNVQATLLLGCAHDLEMKTHTQLQRKAVKTEEQSALRNNMQDMYCPDECSFDEDFDMNNAWKCKDVEGDKFAALKDLFWIKMSDFDEIIRNDDKYIHLRFKNGLPFVKLAIQTEAQPLPTCSWLDVSVEKQSTIAF